MKWQQYIEDDLRSHITAAGALPVALTLPAMAKHYNVSLMPVRRAIGRLIEEGLIEKGENRRLVAKYSKRRAVRQLKSPSKPVDFFDRMALDLIRKSLLGINVDLKEEEVSKEYGISTTLVRQIFHRLAGMGIIEHRPRIGWNLSAIDQNDIDVFMEARSLVEMRAVQLSFDHVDRNRLQRFLETNTTEAGDRSIAINNELHGYLAHASNNRFIKDFFQQNRKYFHAAFRWEEQIQPDDRRRIIAANQHCDIITAMLDGHLELACEYMHHHLSDNPLDLCRFREQHAKIKAAPPVSSPIR